MYGQGLVHMRRNEIVKTSLDSRPEYRGCESRGGLEAPDSADVVFLFIRSEGTPLPGISVECMHQMSLT